MESDHHKLPFVDDALVNYLERLYPDQAPDPSEDERKIWINRGAVGVVRHLKALRKEQRENMLGT